MTTITETHWSDVLVRAGACEKAMAYARTHETFQAAWDACDRADWMLSWLGTALPNTRAHRETLSCLAIRFVLAIPGRKPIDWLGSVGKPVPDWRRE